MWSPGTDPQTQGGSVVLKTRFALAGAGAIAAAAMVMPSASATPTATTADEGVSAQLACRYGHICGKASNGKRFDYYKCKTYRLPGLIGRGPLNNNQTRGTVATFYDKNHRILFKSRAPQKRSVNWTPVEFVKVC